MPLGTHCCCRVLDPSFLADEAWRPERRFDALLHKPLMDVCDFSGLVAWHDEIGNAFLRSNRIHRHDTVIRDVPSCVLGVLRMRHQSALEYRKASSLRPIDISLFRLSPCLGEEYERIDADVRARVHIVVCRPWIPCPRLLVVKYQLLAEIVLDDLNNEWHIVGYHLGGQNFIDIPINARISAICDMTPLNATTTATDDGFQLCHSFPGLLVALLWQR
jgi:hypothetical protein